MRYGLLDAWESLSDPPSGRSPVGLGRSPTRLDFDRLAARHTELSSLDQPHRMEAPRRFLGLHWPLQRLSRRPFDAVAISVTPSAARGSATTPLTPTHLPAARQYGYSATRPLPRLSCCPSVLFRRSLSDLDLRTIARRLSARNMDSADAHALGASGHVQAYRGKLIHVALD